MSPGSHPVRRKMTMVELLIVMAILGILAAILVPAFVQSARRAQRKDSSAAPPATGEGEGVENTIDVPETLDQPSEQPAERRTPAAGWLVSVVVWAIILTLVVRFVRRLKSRLAKGGGGFHDPPDA